MVRGLIKFKEYFGSHNGKYVLIGGTACDIILGNEGVDFRQTKDFDMVLIIEAVDEAFINNFLKFIADGGYSHINKGTGDNQFYRFERPKDIQFPYMIELFSRRPDYLNAIEASISKIHISDDVVSLSAILLDKDYYKALTDGVLDVEGVTVLNLQSIILFKIKAWLDLSLRKETGEQIDSKEIKKHKNDIFRLIVNLSPDTILHTEGKIQRDINEFVEKIQSETVDLRGLGIRGVTKEQLLGLIKKIYR